jgi:hypothetical protein
MLRQNAPGQKTGPRIQTGRRPWAAGAGIPPRTGPREEGRGGRHRYRFQTGLSAASKSPGPDRTPGPVGSGPKGQFWRSDPGKACLGFPPFSAGFPGRRRAPLGEARFRTPGCGREDCRDRPARETSRFSTLFLVFPWAAVAKSLGRLRGGTAGRKREAREPSSIGGNSGRRQGGPDPRRVGGPILLSFCRFYGEPGPLGDGDPFAPACPKAGPPSVGEKVAKTPVGRPQVPAD